LQITEEYRQLDLVAVVKKIPADSEVYVGFLNPT